MVFVKNYYDQLMDNQVKLFNIMMEFINVWMEMMILLFDLFDKVGELMNEYYIKIFEMMEVMAFKEKMEVYQKDFWIIFMVDYIKNMEVSMELYKKLVEYFKNMWFGNIMEIIQECIKKFGELYQYFMKAFYDIIKVNGKVMQEYMSVN